MCEFRRLHTEDLDMVMRMNETFRSGFADRVAAGRFLKNERNWLYAAVCGLNVVGFAYGGVLHRLDGKEDMLYIHEVGVAGPQQRRGIGFSMMSALLQDAGRVGIGKVFLFTDQHNVAANALYRKLGGAVANDSGGQDTVYFFQL